MNGSKAPDHSKGQSGLLRAALFGVCPECGGHTLFSGVVQVADQCRVCALELGAMERWGRVAGIITLLIAALLIAAALALDTYVRPPIWVHVALWVPLTIASVLGALRLMKTAGVYRSYYLAQGRGK